ncbi:ATP-binding protein [Mastigocoleus sp. MO_188.B34]|uniref:ATP-binding protein n=1 Tax=Mastigocoleus sp. MO_188.B34 TaxID=3036635 RepID=UPI002610F77F|nr:ATP-binding protein [Mastigocoleus sp. MO_188.B34]MDJ0697640.1 ATP-binding protein [Mastigocoleus sp. MO_188.B34]
MVSINEIIKREVNPFDRINLKPGDFWEEQQDSTQMVESIHKQVITEIEEYLDLVAKDNRSRSLLLLGDSGSGKSYLLGRVKRTLNPKAFFAYIGPWADSDYIWRHILRSTVDSLLRIPEGQQESQLILWLKNLSAFTKDKSKDKIWQLLRSDRRKFIKHLKSSYKQAGLYNSDIFFGVLHDLTNPELYDLACEWLRGDDLSEESMQALKVKSCIDSEDTAKNILANFGRISTETQPIVLCFDNLDNIPRLPDGSGDFQPLFNVNTTIHNKSLKNFLIIISIVTNTWRHSWYRVQRADKARVDKAIQLKTITLKQAEGLWSYRLRPLHQAANDGNYSEIFPLNRKLLEENYPGGKTQPRDCLILGRKEYQKYKLSLLEDKIPEPSTVPPPATSVADIPSPKPNIDIKDKIQAEFKLIWQEELKKTQGKISKISFLAAPDLIRMLQQALEALQIKSVKPKLISGKYASYSLSYQHPKKGEKIGIVWTEDANMVSFYNIMNASQKVIQKQACQKLYLIRISGVGNSRLKGNQIYQQIFKGSQKQNIHLKPDLSSVHELATYYSLVNSAHAQELVVAGKAIHPKELQSLIRESKILEQCTLLQGLGIVAILKRIDSEPIKKDLRSVKEFLLNVVKTQGYMGFHTLIQYAIDKYSYANENDIQGLVKVLRDEKKVKIINPKEKLKDQLICLVI